MTAYLTIFRKFPTTFRRFLKIPSKNLSEGHTNAAEHFPKIAEDCRRLLRTTIDKKMFRSYTNEFKYNLRDKLEMIEIFTGGDMENTPPTSRMWFCMNFTSGVFSSKTLLPIVNGLNPGVSVVSSFPEPVPTIFNDWLWKTGTLT